MTTVLGKRKSRSAASEPAVSYQEAQDIFRRHFEAQFNPLAGAAAQRPPPDSDEDEDAEGDGGDDDEDDDADGWEGVSDSEDSAPEIEVVEHNTAGPAPNPLAAALAKRQARAFLSSKVPMSAVSPAGANNNNGNEKKQKQKQTPVDEDSADLVRNDLALQRLLSESHLLNRGPGSSLDKVTATTATTIHAGRTRHLATDLRLAHLGAKASIYKQARMPMSHRKGIEAAREARETKRRREAKENGIILERPSATAAAAASSLSSFGPKRRKREAAVDAPAVGKLHNGMLKLSKRDIADIEGSGGGRGRGGRGRGGGRGRSRGGGGGGKRR
ncbi:hypothetical protein BX600DRAFT_515738 [Xylariales sp. PMI_506]|nr:hypothetical protein BX600DRAFT_515738 [Xylariales sp. PMI_506]